MLALNKLKDRIRYCKFNLFNIKNFIFNFDSYIKSYVYKNNNGSIGVIMCVWDEGDNILDALESSYKYVDKFYIIDKDGKMKKYVDLFFSDKDVPFYYEVCSKLNLLESRLYAISLIKEGWVLNQDGDEILLKPELLKTLTNKYNVCYQTRKRVNKHYVQPYHNFLFHNNGNHLFLNTKDIPRYRGRHIRLNYVMIENRHFNKSVEHINLRNHIWFEFQYSGFKGLIEDYVKV